MPARPACRTHATRRALGVALAAVGVVTVAPSCGGDTMGIATTVVGVTPTAFATIPPVASTLPGTTTSLPSNAVGEETIYTVVAGDSPISVATKFGITVSLLLSYNALLTPQEFPYPGQTLKIPAAAVIQPQGQGTTTGSSTPAGPVGPGCSRPAGTYTIQAGDSLWAITKKFCISTAQLIAANEWPDGGVTLLPGQIISIPAAG